MATGGLKKWGSQSECTHAVSKNLAGPYKKIGEAIPIWCHNPNTIKDKKGNYLLFHIGAGNSSKSSSFLHVASSPNGPWVPSPTSPDGCNNPAPAFHPNGTLFVVCDHISMTYASSWNGTWSPKRIMGHPHDDRQRHWEDPFLWFDRRGNWHVMYHVYCLLPYSSGKECYSGHAYSEDGLYWIFSPIEPFNGTIRFVDGSSRQFSTRERSHLVFSDEKRTTPIAVITGVSSHPVDSSCDHCKHTACSQCKVTDGMDWTFTQLEPFAK